MSGFGQPAILEVALGGLLPGRSYLVHGDPGVGKTTLALQVAHAWTAVDRRVALLTADPPEHLLQQAALLGLSLNADWTQERFILCPYAPSVSEQVGALGMVAFLERIGRLGSTLGVGGLILDPLVPLFRAYGRPAEVRRNVATLIGSLEEWGWSALLLSRSDALHRQSGLFESLQERCWGTLELALARGGEARAPFVLRVGKARQKSVPGGIVPYTIALEGGLIPVDAAHGAPGDDRAALSGEPSRRCVLIACLDADLVRQLEEILAPRMRVELASAGAEALSLAATLRPDVVVLQQDLPGISGLALARALRQGRYTMPVILLSLGGRRRSDRVRALLHGATDFVEHPCDVEALAARIQTAGYMRLTGLPARPEDGARLEALQVLGRGREMRKAEFLEALAVALRCARHFASPVSLIAFCCESGGDPAGEQITRRFFELLTTGTREGDLLCFPGAGVAVALLCHEHHGGALALAGRLRRRIEEEFPQADTIGAWRIDMAARTFFGEEPGDAAPRVLLDALLAETRPFARGIAGVARLRATGTDGA